MRLLPDFEMDGILFSLQYPYTVNGHLITEIREQENFTMCRTEIVVTTDNCHDYFMAKSTLENCFTMRFFEYRRCYGPSFVNENGFFSHIPYENFNGWLREISIQCDELESDSPNPTSLYHITCYGEERGEKWFSLLNTLKNQNRDEAYERENINIPVERNQISGFGTTVYTSSCGLDTTISFNQNSTFQDPENSSEWNIVRDRLSQSQLEEEWRRLYRDCVDTRQIISEPFISSAPGKSHIYIHSHNYKPEFIKHTNSSSSLLLGVEIEVAGNKHEQNRDEVVKKCIQIMNGSDSDEESLIYSTHDGTVQIELDTMPCSLEVHKTLNYKEMFKYLVSIGYRGHDCENAGMHIHVDREYLGDTKFKQQLVISKIIYILEKFNADICVIARKNHEYSQFIGGSNDTPFTLYQAYKDYGKRAALNLQHDETIEFRCFRSTLKYETFILTLEFVQCIVDFAKTINIEEIESVTWQDLMAKFPKSVQDYYTNRKQREEVQQKDPILKELKKQLKNLKSALSHALNNMEKTRLKKEIEGINKQIKQRKANKKKEKGNTGSNNEESTYICGRNLSNIASSPGEIGRIANLFTSVSDGYGILN